MRLKGIVMRRLGYTSKKGQLQRKWSYQKQKLLKTLTVTEEEMTKTADDRSSLQEVEFKQKTGASRGLLYVNDSVYYFFTDMHKQLQSQLSESNLHLYLENIHLRCRNFLMHNDILIQKWINLFEVEDEEDENAVFLIMLFELYEVITEHFLRISLAEAVTKFKESIPRTKKQALRSKIQALSERAGVCEKKPKLDVSPQDSVADVFFCGSCEKQCVEEPDSLTEQSIACDSCNKWFHYSCMKIKGSENFLKSTASSWKCVTCRKGKGKGKCK